MNIVFTKEGFQRLLPAWAILGVSVAAAVAIAWGSHAYLQKENRDGMVSKRQLAEAQARVAAARRERDDLAASSALFEDLVNRGILKEESRIDLVERLDRLKARHRLISLDYEIQPQRALPLAGGRTFNAIDILGSRVKIRAQALHEGDALAFLEDLAMPPRGFNPINRCTLRRVESGAISAAAPRVEADCTLDFVSLKDKRGNRAG